MTYVFALVLLGVFILMASLAYFSVDGRFGLLGTLGVFGIGYYVLPVFFQAGSGLFRLQETQLEAALLLCVFFMVFLVVGTVVSSGRLLSDAANVNLRVAWVDWIVDTYPRMIFLVCGVLWAIQSFLSPRTSYSADDFNAYFLERGPLDGLLSAISGYAIGGMAFLFARAVVQAQLRTATWMGAVIFVALISLLSSAQRLAVIAPVFSIFAAFTCLGAGRRAISVTGIGVGLLLLISPVMVALRQTQSGGGGAFERLITLDWGALFEGKGGGVFFDSILGRADLLEVTGYLMSYADASGGASSEYFLSVIAAFVPRFLWTDKPFPLSDDGTIWGSLSVIAWVLFQGNSIGSLSAFGPISAYWEGGWWWVPMNGLLTGFTLSLVYLFLARGGSFAKIIFATVFPICAIKNVPPSFFELLTYLSASINLCLVVYLLNFVISCFFSDRAESAKT